MERMDGWDPALYDTFERERSQPFFDLADLLDHVDFPTLVDLGCGTAKLTRWLHDHVGAADTLGIDSSPAMLAQNLPAPDDGTRFRTATADIADDDALDELGVRNVDVIFSNAAFQWVPDHLRVLERVAGRLAAGGQLAVQVPANGHHPSHRLAATVAAEEPFLDAMGGAVPPGLADVILRPDEYAEALHRWGFAQQSVRLQVYGHVLDGTEDVVTWVRATLLQRYLSKLPEALHEPYVRRFAEAFRDHEGDRRPYFYAFSRILMWGRLPHS